MGRASFSEATVQFQSVRTSSDHDALLKVDKLERIILDHIPRSPFEAVAMLDVVIPEVSAGGRSDGRDVKALKSIRTMLTELRA